MQLTGKKTEKKTQDCVSGTMDRHVRLNSGRSTINTVAVTHKFPLLWGFMTPKGEAAQVGGHIV